MKDLSITIPVSQRTYDELTDAERNLVDLAREAYGRAYAPYSHFHV